MALKEALGNRRDCAIICYCDNMAAVTSLVKGNSRNGHMDEMVHSVHLFAASRGCRLYFEWTPSESNPSDEPSRAATYLNMPVPRVDVPEEWRSECAKLFAEEENFIVSTMMQEGEHNRKP